MDAEWRGQLHELTPDGMAGPQIAGSEAVVRRTADSIEFEIRTSAAKPGNSYTVWLMAFNNPMACSGDGAPAGFRCGPSDMGNPDAGFGLMYGTGAWAEAETLKLAGRRTVNDPAGVEMGSAGLTDANNAEIHLRVRDHGPAQHGMEMDQVGSLMGGCTDDSPPGGGSGVRGSYGCRDVQATGL